MEIFVSPLSAVIARFITFLAGSVLVSHVFRTTANTTHARFRSGHFFQRQ
jgi:hypothetical protein